jgi:hypothetical protein
MKQRKTSPATRTPSASVPPDAEARIAMLNDMQQRSKQRKKPPRRKRLSRHSPLHGAETKLGPAPAVNTRDTLDAAELRSLLAGPAEHRVSMYMPVYPPGPDGLQNPIRLKNLLRRAEEMLVDKGMRAAEARELLQQPHSLVPDKAFWRRSQGGLGLLVSRDVFRCYQLRSPVDESAWVSNRFRIRPLLPLMDGDNRFWLLAISGNQVRLFRGDQESLEPVEVADLPKNIEETLNLDVSKTGDQVHSANSLKLGKQSAVFHGQGGEPDAHKADLRAYCQAIDAAVHDALNAAPAPLLLACVEYVFPIYREANRYPHLLERPLTGNADYLVPHELHAQAWPLVEPHLHKGRREAAGRYQKLLAAGKVAAGKASPHIAEIIPAAFEGRVDTLFLANDAKQWGTVESESKTVTVHAELQPGDEDLLDLAAVETLAHSGAVYCVPANEVPDSGAAAALFRY